mmetsp:Transcript_30122/g.76335  ORF Transcript_30122/g.76335 Transcript_30122/m.76335 type:complete len:405 (+) Transcript_30122:771-1985(+)
MRILVAFLLVRHHLCMPQALLLGPLSHVVPIHIIQVLQRRHLGFFAVVKRLRDGEGKALQLPHKLPNLLSPAVPSRHPRRCKRDGLLLAVAPDTHTPPVPVPLLRPRGYERLALVPGIPSQHLLLPLELVVVRGVVDGNQPPVATILEQRVHVATQIHRLHRLHVVRGAPSQLHSNLFVALLQPIGTQKGHDVEPSALARLQQKLSCHRALPRPPKTVHRQRRSPLIVEPRFKQHHQLFATPVELATKVRDIDLDALALFRLNHAWGGPRLVAKHPHLVRVALNAHQRVAAARLRHPGSLKGSKERVAAAQLPIQSPRESNRLYIGQAAFVPHGKLHHRPKLIRQLLREARIRNENANGGLALLQRQVIRSFDAGRQPSLFDKSLLHVQSLLFTMARNVQRGRS